MGQKTREKNWYDVFSGVFVISTYVILLPLLPLFHFIKWFKTEKLTSDKEDKNGRTIYKKYVPFDIYDHGIPLFFCLVYVVLVFLPLMGIGEWDAAQSTVEFLTTILQFLLPLQIVAAITRNRTGMGAFTTFTSKMLQLYHHLQKEDKLDENTKFIFQNIGKAVKWEIRGSLDVTKLPNYKEGTPNSIVKMLDNIYKYIAEQGKEISKAREAANYKLLNDASAAYSDMRSLSEFKIPLLFVSFFYVVMTAYFSLLPYTFPDDEPGVKVLKCVINLYVFLGMFNISVFISNPFQSSTNAVQTVSSVEHKYSDMIRLEQNTELYIPYSTYMKLKI